MVHVLGNEMAGRDVGKGSESAKEEGEMRGRVEERTGPCHP